MSTDEEPDQPLRTVTDGYFGAPNVQMDVIGWVIFLALMVVLLPLLPFVALFWLVSKIGERTAPGA